MLRTLSPTRANDLLACSYRVALALDPSYSHLSRPTPASELGTLAHKLVDAVGHGLLRPAVDRAAAELLLNAKWSELENAAHHRLAEAWAPSAVPAATDWRGYHVTRTRVIRRALRLFDTGPPNRRPPGSQARVEGWLSDPATGLGGQPDRVEGPADDRCIVDLKTSLEQAGASDAQRRQLLLYAHLVGVDEGKPPTRIAIEDASGRRWEERTTPAEIAGAVAEVLDARRRFNSSVQQGNTAELAAPGADTCRYCAYRPVCGPFWCSLKVDWQHGAAAGDITGFEPAPAGSILRLRSSSPGDDARTNWTVTAVPAHVEASVGQTARIVGAESSGSPRHLRWRWSTVIETDG